MDKLKNNIYHTFNLINARLNHLEKKIAELDEKLDEVIQIERSHLVRVKNGEELSDDFILKGRTYYDLSPEQAFELYNDPDKDFILLDVSAKGYQAFDTLPEAIKIPLEELAIRHQEIQNKNTTLFIMSENGVRSILACELLQRCGFHNINNISGGHKFWPGHKKIMAEKNLKTA